MRASVVRKAVLVIGILVIVVTIAIVFMERSQRRILIIRVFDSSGAIGYGECTAPEAPFYNHESVDTAWAIITKFIAPMLAAAKVRLAPFGTRASTAHARPGWAMYVPAPTVMTRLRCRRRRRSRRTGRGGAGDEIAGAEQIEELIEWDTQVATEDVSLVESVQRGAMPRYSATSLTVEPELIRTRSVRLMTSACSGAATSSSWGCWSSCTSLATTSPDSLNHCLRAP